MERSKAKNDPPPPTINIQKTPLNIQKNHSNGGFILSKIDNVISLKKKAKLGGFIDNWETGGRNLLTLKKPRGGPD